MAASAVKVALRTKVIVTRRPTSMPRTVARLRFWATACIAHPSHVRAMKS